MDKVLGLLLMLTSLQASADSFRIHGVSHHFDSGSWNESNVGVGYRIDGNVINYQLGVYKNSMYSTTVYALADYKVLLTSGLFLGLATGYKAPVIGGLFVDFPKSGVTLRFIPAVRNVTPAVLAAEIGFKL